MTTATIYPNATVSTLNITVVGAGSANAAISDFSDGSYVELGVSGAGTGFLLVDMGTFTLPAGAVVYSATNYYRAGLAGSFGVTNEIILNRRFSNQAVYTGGLPAVGGAANFSNTFTDASGVPVQTQADIDGYRLNMASGDQAVRIRVFEASVGFVYIVVPTSTATGPTGTSTTNSSPTVTWTYSGDADAPAGQTKYQVRVFNAAQYSVGGFDPATSAATYDTGAVGSSALSATVGPLPNGTYRAYVRAATTTLGVDQWAASWTFTSFVTAVPPLAAGLSPIVGTVRNTANNQVVLTWRFTSGSGSSTDKQTAYQVTFWQVSNKAGTLQTGVKTAQVLAVGTQTGTATITLPATSWTSETGVALGWAVRVYDESDVVSAYSSDNLFTSADPIVTMTVQSPPAQSPTASIVDEGAYYTGPIDISSANGSDISAVAWNITANSGTVVVQTTMDYGVTWQVATNGGVIPNFSTARPFPSTLQVRVAFVGPAPYSVLNSLTVTAGSDLLIDAVTVRWAYSPPDPTSGSVEKASVRRTGEMTTRGKSPRWFDLYNFIFVPYVEVKVFEGTLASPSYLRVSGAASNRVTTPDAAALNIIGNLDLRVKVALDDWTPAALQTLISKYTTSQKAYALRVTTIGTLQFVRTSDGTTDITYTSNVATGIADGAARWIRAFFQQNVAGVSRVDFYTGVEDTSTGVVTWTVLGAAQQNVSIAPTFVSTAALEIGSDTVGLNRAAGNFYRAQVLSNTTPRFDADFQNIQADTATVQESVNLAVVTLVKSGTTPVSIAPVWMRFNLGRLYNTLPTTTDDGIVTTATYQLADRTYKMVMTPLINPLTVPVGTNPITFVTTRLTGLGETLFNLGTTSVVTTSDYFYDVDEPELDVMNSVLQATGFAQLIVDESGYWITAPATDLAARASEWSYISGTTVKYEATIEPQLADIPNKIVFTPLKGGPSLITEGSGQRTKTNQSTGPSSIDNRGEVVTRKMQVDAQDQTALDLIASAEAQRIFNGGGYNVSLKVALNPLHSDTDVVTVEKPRLGITPSTWLVTSWEISLQDAVGGEEAYIMSVSASRRVGIT